MTTQGSGNITLEDFKVIVQRAGLGLTTEEMEQFAAHVPATRQPDKYAP